jgi:hypothetical protein
VLGWSAGTTRAIDATKVVPPPSTAARIMVVGARDM